MTPGIAQWPIGVIDDDVSVRKALTAFLHSCGFQVQAFDCAESFLAEGHHDAWHCLIIDLGLPGLSGFELHEKLVSSGRQAPPVIFVSALDDRSGALAREASRRGARGLLQKPFLMKQLLVAIELI